jgi:nicotinamidase-related amidase
MTHDPFYDLVPRPQEPDWAAGSIALITIDLQYSDAHPDGWMGRLADHRGRPELLQERWDGITAILPNVRRLQDAFRAAGQEAMHVRVAYRTRDGRDAGKAYMPAPEDLAIPQDAHDDDFLEEVAPVGDEIIFNKTSAGVFNSTAIDSVLRRMGISRLVFTGIVTDGCVELSARDAADRGYLVMLVADGCSASTQAAHEDALARLSDGGFIAVKSTDEVVALLDQIAASRGSAMTAAAT